MKIISKKMSKGFTLLEMLVVVLIIGILAGIALPQYNRAVEKTRLAEALLNASSLQKAINSYILTKGYPATGTIQFLGSDPDETLDIDITQGLNCEDDDVFCFNKDFYYAANCDTTNCYIAIFRIKDNSHPDDDNFLYRLVLTTRGKSEEWNFKECMSNSSYNTEYICKHLESQGFERTEC